MYDKLVIFAKLKNKRQYIGWAKYVYVSEICGKEILSPVFYWYLILSCFCHYQHFCSSVCTVSSCFTLLCKERLHFTSCAPCRCPTTFLMICLCIFLMVNKLKSSPHFVTFPPSIFNFPPSFFRFSFFSSPFPFFPCLFFPGRSPVISRGEISGGTLPCPLPTVTPLFPLKQSHKFDRKTTFHHISFHGPWARFLLGKVS